MIYTAEILNTTKVCINVLCGPRAPAPKSGRTFVNLSTFDETRLGKTYNAGHWSDE